MDLYALAQENDPDSILNCYRAALALRKVGITATR